MNVEFAREQMIDQQVHTWQVFDERVLDAMRAVPRDRFVPTTYRGVAFADAPIPLTHGQSMLPAKVHGRILQALAIDPGDVGLVVGAGTGYLPACMARLASRVRALEIYPDLAAEARAHLLAIAANNAAIEVVDGSR